MPLGVVYFQGSAGANVPYLVLHLVSGGWICLFNGEKHTFFEALNSSSPREKGQSKTVIAHEGLFGVIAPFKLSCNACHYDAWLA